MHQGSSGTGPRGARVATSTEDNGGSREVEATKVDTPGRWISKTGGLQTKGCFAVVRAKGLGVYKATWKGPKNAVKK